jgi:hypothetical protein
LRAREVLTKLSQSREGLAFGEVRISTTSPFWMAVLSGTIRPLMREPVQVFPTSVWIMKAKSTGVAPRGSWMTLPIGVKA